MRAALAAAGFQAVPAYAGHGDGGSGKTVRLTVMGTTDLHGNVFNWDYFKNTEYDDAAHNDIGLAKISTLVTAVRDRIAAERHAPRPLLLDAGDTIQGTPLAYYFAKIEPITGGHIHPMAAAMNQIGYDAAALGNHEFNYGLDILRKFQRQLRFPLLGANAQDWTTGLPVFPPYVLKRVHVPGEKPITVGILGLTNPGIAIWDKANVENKIKFGGIVELAKLWVPRVRKAGADVVIVSAHSGMDLSSSYGDALPYPENASVLMAETVPGIDAVLVGHAHLEIPERLVTNTTSGEQVVLTEPLKWGMRLSLIDLDLQKVRGRWKVVGRHSQVLNANTVDADPKVVARPAEGPRQGRRVRQRRRSAPARRRCPRRPRRGRTPPRWTSSTSSRPTRCRRPWPVRRRPRCRCSRSPRRSTGRPRSRPVTSRCATWPGSTSSTTRCSR